jgi:CelD/BcsL family acetyltransferase involved in cellulose biosynthesis
MPTKVDPDLKARWLELISDNKRITAFQDPDWILTDSGDFELIFESPNGIAPCFKTVRNSTRTIRLYGADFEDIVAKEGEEKAFFSELISFLDSRSDWDICDFRSLAPESSILAGVQDHPKYVMRMLPQDSYQRVLLPSTWEEYESHLGRKLSYQLRAESRRRVKYFGVDGLRIATAETFKEDFEAFIGLHTKRWNLKGKPGLYGDPLQADAFYRKCAELHSRGKVRLYTVWFGGVPGGALLAFQDLTRICFYSCGFDEEFKKFQPVKVLIARAIQDGISLGLKEFNLMKGDEPYKEVWGNDVQPMTRLVIAKKNIRGYLALWVLTAQAKHKQRRRKG